MDKGRQRIAQVDISKHGDPVPLDRPMIAQLAAEGQPEFALSGDVAPPVAEPLADIVCEFAVRLRDLLEPIWPVWKSATEHPAPHVMPPSADCCIPTSLVLRNVLARSLPEIRWRTLGGRPTRKTPQGGYTDAHGVVHPHLWVEGRRGRERILVDITADQFGAPPVLVINGGSSRYHANHACATYRKFEVMLHGTVWLWGGGFDMAMRAEADQAGGIAGLAE